MAAGFAPAAESGEDVALLTNVSVRFGDHPILREVDLLVRAGDRIAVIGPNGAGKNDTF